MPHHQQAGMVDERGCSAAQQWLWALDQLIGPSPEYNVYQAVLLDGQLEASRLRGALTEVVHRHPVLRTVYHARDGRPIPVLVPVDLLAVRELSAPDLDAAVALAGELVAAPFLLDRDLPVRMWLIRLADGSVLLVLCLHHIATDAWSLEIIWRELAAGYAGAPLPPVALPEPSDNLEPAEVADQLDFWRRELAGLEPAELPADRPRPARRSGRGAQLAVELPNDLTDRLSAFVRRRGSTLFPVLVAAVEVVLARWTRNGDVTIGTVVSGRSTEASESVVGYQVNTVVLRDRLRADDTAESLLDRLREQLLEVCCNTDVPFADVVAAMGKLHDPRRNPFFDVMVTLQDEATAAFSPPGFQVTPVTLPTVTSKFDLSFMFTTGPAGLSAQLAYATDLFDEATGHRIAQQVRTVLERICAQPTALLGTLDILPETERKLLLRHGQGTPAQLDPCSIPAIFGEWARTAPAAPAVLCGAQTLSYAELDEASDRLAHRLSGRIALGDRVAVRLDRGLHLVIALLGVLKAGGCYVAVDVSVPAERSDAIIAASGCAYAITEQGYRELVAEQLGPVEPLPQVSADHLAYVMFTSGSTGRPKGVQVSQRSVVNLSQDMAARLRLGPRGVVAAVASHAFDMSVLELITPLLCGAALRLVSRAAAAGPADLAAELAYATFAQLTPSHWQLLLDDGWSDRRLVAGCGAEPLPPALAVRLVGAVAELWNFYGPTETTVWSTAAGISDGIDDRLPVPIGTPLRNTFAAVLDEALNLAPVGVPGQLYLGGAGVAVGYHDAAALTAASFLPDPWHPGQRLYRTGDLVRWRPDGQLEFQARVDYQVKIRGFRIELAEVEMALERHPDVVRAAVAVRGEDADRFLAGFLVLRPHAELDEIRRFLGGVLPHYMVPAVLQRIDKIPLSSNGKMDRRQLPAGQMQRPAGGGSLRTDTERTVAAVFESVLQVVGVGRDDDFFALGGHSLGAARAVSSLRARLRRPVSVQTLFQHSGVAALAEVLDSLTEQELQPAEHPMPELPTPEHPTAEQPAELDQPAVRAAPLSSQQQRLWLLDRLQPGRVDYNVQRVLRLRGPLDRAQLAEALSSVGDRHELLRTRFPADRGRPRAVVDVPVPELRFTELPKQPSASMLAAATEIAQADVDQPLDLAAGPLWRARLIRLAADDHVLVLVFHHIVIDGGSFEVFWRDLARAYRGQALPPAAPYSAYARREQGAVIDAESLEYWRQRLVEPAGTELPVGRQRPVERSGAGAEVRFEVGAELTGRLHDLARSAGVTFFGLGLAAFAVVLARFSRHREVLLGTPVSGRNEATEDMIGCFVNTLALRVDCAPDSTVRQLLRAVRTVIAEGYGNQSIPFERLVEELQPVRDLSRNPIFQIMFAVPAVEAVDLAGLRAEPVLTTATTAKFDLSVEFAPTGTGSVVYDAELYDREHIENVLDAFRTVLTELPASLDVPVRELLASRPESAPPVTGAAAARSLPTRVLAAIERAPAAVAARSGTAELSYAELGRQSVRLAGWLRRQGIGRGDLVAVQLPVGFDFLAAMLGVSRAGAAFVPLDPSHPAQRRAQLVEQAGVRVVVDRWPVASTDGIEPTTEVGLTAADLLGVYFTSGSSGPPKAVRETHGGVANFFDYLERQIGVAAGDVVLQLAASTFDASLRDLFGPLAAGACAVLLEPDQRRDPYQVVRVIEEQAVTALLAVVPSVLAALVRASRGRTVDLRLILVSGEVLTAQLAAAVSAWAPNARLVNQYGPTECTMTSTWHEVTAADVRSGVVPVGTPIPGVTAQVVGSEGQPLPAGALGELWLGGAGLSQGYQSAAQTADRFIPNPFAAGQRLYRTGDLVHRRRDGRLIFHGRIDSQLKVRGVRIEPAELEQALVDCSGVRSAAVALRGGVLAAYLVGSCDVARVWAELASKLPPTMHPDRIVRVAELPYNSNGKLDRARLPEPIPQADAATLPARDVAELTMAAVWQQVLGLPAVGVQDDFFAVGGNSLKAVEVVELLHREHQVELPMHLLFTHPTVERLCAALPEWRAADGLLVRLRDGDPGQPPLVLVHAQSGEVCSYIDLVRELRGPGPVVGVEAVGYNDDEPVLDRIEAMAARYLQELRSMLPAAPYRLAGWSFGGNVAFEMAHQLEQAGERVEFLGIIDARAFGQDGQESWYLAKPEAARFGLVAGLPVTDADALKDLDESSLLEVLLAHAREQGAVSHRATSATMRRMLAVFSANGRAAERYRTRAVLSSDIHLFRAGERHPTLTNPVVDPAAWQARTTGRLWVHQVAGTHHDLLDRNHAPAFARQLEDALAVTEAES